MAILSDGRIQELLSDAKPVHPKDVQKLKLKLKPTARAQLGAQILVKSERNRHFRIAARVGQSRKHDFSIRLMFFFRKRWINLIRCNGHHTLHVNELEKRSGVGVAKIPPNTFHIHQATERYQSLGKDAESYAEPTDKYDSFQTAVEFLCRHFGCFNSKERGQRLLPFLE